jgi:hypothetical protein
MRLVDTDRLLWIREQAHEWMGIREQALSHQRYTLKAAFKQPLSHDQPLPALPLSAPQALDTTPVSEPSDTCKAAAEHDAAALPLPSIALSSILPRTSRSPVHSQTPNPKPQSF